MVLKTLPGLIWVLSQEQALSILAVAHKQNQKIFFLKIAELSCAYLFLMHKEYMTWDFNFYFQNIFFLNRHVFWKFNINIYGITLKDRLLSYCLKNSELL